MGPSKMAAIEIFWLHFSNNRRSIQSFFLRSVAETRLPRQGEGIGHYRTVMSSDRHVLFRLSVANLILAVLKIVDVIGWVLIRLKLKTASYVP